MHRGCEARAGGGGGVAKTTLLQAPIWIVDLRGRVLYSAAKSFRRPDGYPDCNWLHVNSLIIYHAVFAIWPFPGTNSCTGVVDPEIYPEYTATMVRNCGPYQTRAPA
eukprot:6186769-Pleurochrysis_carterae.AAC.2